MQRRTFLQVSAAAPAGLVPKSPDYRLVSPYKAVPRKDFPAKAAAVHASKSIDAATGNADPVVVREMVARGMCALTGAAQPADAWRHFFTPADVVGIKVNCSGAPRIMSHPLVVAEIVRSLLAVSVKPENITIYERFPGQLESVDYGKYLETKVAVTAVEMERGSIRGYDPRAYVEANFFGEDDTRSHLVRMLTDRFTKIINVPNMKDHQASGVTGCLKNMAYGNFSNVARSHRYEVSHTRTFIGTLASLEPLRSKTVLHIMDGLKGVWHGGPFLNNPRFAFFPKQMMFGTDPVAMDRLLVDIIDEKRIQEGGVSVWDRSRSTLSNNAPGDPTKGRFIRETGHIEYAASLGLGEYSREKIQLREIRL